ncbi:unnamed protein product [Trifolium pratense]|uniref:Uncharacterized protein n=1 Tax=Trifolium pratense TaxID=57577 RepID=A0ACB0JKV4_TRIPR|nr:unnamed protein product [Trifolium pratense]
MQEEIDALNANNTWSIVDLPKGKVPIGCKWVYRVKYHANGSIERYKARLVVKGYTQLEGVDYFDTFSPVAKLTTVKTLLALASIKGWYLEQLDVNNAFLHGDLHEEIFMSLPPGINIQGLEVARNKEDILLNQRKYTLELLEDSGNLVGKSTLTPYDISLKLQNSDSPLYNDETQYRRLIGRLIYLTTTRPDISFAVQQLSQFVSKPRQIHYQAAVSVLQYLKTAPAKGLFYSATSNFKLSGFADSDWATCPTTRKSVTGYSCSLAPLSFHGNPRSSLSSPNQALKQNIVH